jgi:uncharacterized membrane protein YdjX (TVP38/TMEM64 family)
MRLVWIFVGLVVLILIPFAIWGAALESIFTATGAIAWLRQYGRWAWAAGLTLLAADLVLPIPGTIIISALGYVYGPLVGGFLGAAGSFLSGALAYLLCRGLGQPAARWLLGQHDLERSERLFATVGTWIVVLSRWLPVLPEAVACMAGLTRMPPPLFFIALACGSLPLGFTFAAVGYAGVAHPMLALLLSALIPPLLWMVTRRVLRARLLLR